jgi:hypothetical protein
MMEQEREVIMLGRLKCVEESGCFRCISHASDRKGYVVTWKNRKFIYGSRYVYELKNGIMPKGMVIRHTCDTPWCVNPEHLLIGTFKDNTRDMIDRGRRKGYMKLNPDSAKEIFNVGQSCRRGERENCAVSLATKYGVSRRTIFNVWHKEYWKSTLQGVGEL